MRIQPVRSATLRSAMADLTLLVDPWLAAKGEGRSYAGTRRSPLVSLPMPVEDVVAGIDAVLVSHLHSDHFDEAARTALDLAIPIFAHERDAAALRALGFTDVRPVGAGLDLGRVRITTMGGRQGPLEILDEMGEVAGFVLRAPGGPVLYWVGDSILCDEVRAVIAAERPDVVVVLGCGVTWGGAGPLVVDADMVVATLRLSAPAAVVVTHMDAGDHATVTRADLREAARHEPAEERLLIPEDGESLEVTAA